MNLNVLSYSQYVAEALGVRYLPQAQASSVTPASLKSIWTKPSFHPQLIFLNMDSNTHLAEVATEDLYGKIVQAMGFHQESVWYVDSSGRSFMDFLNWLKAHHLVVPLVVMKTEPDIQSHVQNAGVFNWVECFSLRAMLENQALKKPTWEVLKILLEKK